MAKKDKPSPHIGARSFKRTGQGFTPIAVGEEIRGKFVRMRSVTFRKEGESRTIKAYDLKLADGSDISIAGRSLLDDAFSDVMDALGVDLINKEISIIRGEDVETSTTEETGNMMQTFEVLVWDKASF